MKKWLLFMVVTCCLNAYASDKQSSLFDCMFPDTRYQVILMNRWLKWGKKTRDACRRLDEALKKGSSVSEKDLPQLEKRFFEDTHTELIEVMEAWHKVMGREVAQLQQRVQQVSQEKQRAIEEGAKNQGAAESK